MRLHLHHQQQLQQHQHQQIQPLLHLLQGIMLVVEMLLVTHLHLHHHLLNIQQQRLLLEEELDKH
jgi:hypothetical protein